MIRRFCDQCGTEITTKNESGPNRLSITIGKLSVEVITAKDKTWNDGDFCKYCILNALNALDDRAKPI